MCLHLLRVGTTNVHRQGWHAGAMDRVSELTESFCFVDTLCTIVRMCIRIVNAVVDAAHARIR